MSRSISIAIIVVLAVAGAAAGFGLYRFIHQGDAMPEASKASAKPSFGAKLVGTARPAFSLTGLDGKPHSISEWNGKVILLNFWASWCPPCRREIPAFIKLQNEYGAKGLQVIGVAIDKRKLVQEYHDTASMNYPVLVGELPATKISQHYGDVYGELPYTVFIDRSGKIAKVHLGEITAKNAERVIKSLL